MTTMLEHEIKINGHGFKITIRDVIQFVVTGLAVVGIYFLSGNRLTTLERSVIDLYKKNLEIITAVADMDKSGTHRSHEIDATQQQQIEQNAREIENINRAIRDLSPKVDKIDTNVLWLMAKQLEHK